MSDNNMVRGQSFKMSSLNNIVISHSYANEKGFDVDLFVFLVDGKNKCRVNNIIFYNNTITKEKSLEYNEYEKNNTDYKYLNIQFRLIEPSIEKIYLGCEFYRTAKVSKEIQEREYTFQILGSDNYATLGQFKDKVNSNNQSVVLGELYLYKDEWKYRHLIRKSQENIKKTVEKSFQVEFM